METLASLVTNAGVIEPVPPSGGSLEIGNFTWVLFLYPKGRFYCSPFGGIPRNWKRQHVELLPVLGCSPFGGIPRNWKHLVHRARDVLHEQSSPFGGIPRNWKPDETLEMAKAAYECSSPFGGIPRNWKHDPVVGSQLSPRALLRSPFGGIPRNWKLGILD